MAVNSENEMNLKTLQRVDSKIVQIIDNASQVAIYKYEKKLNKWEGTDIEGSLFLYKRSVFPYHGFIIVNRLNTTNFNESISSDMEFLVQEPYFLYKKNSGDIIGSWFYEQKDFRRITNKIQSIVLKQSSPLRRQRRSSDSDTHLKKDKAAQNIMTLLSEAHEDYIITETKSKIPENNEQNCYDSTTRADITKSKKTFDVFNKQIKSPHTQPSSKEKTTVALSRKLLSTGSYDSASTPVQYQNKLLNMLIDESLRSSKSRKKQTNKTVDSSRKLEIPIKNVPATNRSSNCTKDYLSAPPVDQIDEQKKFYVPSKKNITKNLFADVPAASNSVFLSSQKVEEQKKTDLTLHASDLKQALVSHITEDSDMILKIHEAYVASLKSVFTERKN